MTSRQALSAVSVVSLVYDLVTGILLLTATATFAGWFGMAVPSPVIFVKLNAVFLIAVGAGYLQPLRDPEGHRAYLWIFGVLLKGGGAAVFLTDHYANGSPDSFLLFAASDGVLAVATLGALLLRRR